jgi:dihydropteroate synthase
MLDTAVATRGVAIMGICNVTPDSFSDGGLFLREEDARARIDALLAEGVDLVDVGGESTRPGAEPVGWEEEWARVEEPLAELVAALGCKVLLSIDTYHPETARRAVELGVKMINCVSGESASAMIEIARSAHGVQLVLPAGSRDLVPEELFERVYLDPMIGFGTTREEDLALLKSVPELAASAWVLVGASRKRIVKKLTGEKVTGKNLGGNLGIAIWCAMNGAAIVRVHDVRETVQALKVIAALSGEEESA